MSSRRRAITHNYVLVQTEALTHRRLGVRVARRLFEDVVPIKEIVGSMHGCTKRRSRHIWRGLRRRSLLVDHVSFELMRRRGVRTTLALDHDFAREGFELLRSP